MYQRLFFVVFVLPLVQCPTFMLKQTQNVMCERRFSFTLIWEMANAQRQSCNILSFPFVRKAYFIPIRLVTMVTCLCFCTLKRFLHVFVLLVNGARYVPSSVKFKAALTPNFRKKAK